MQVPRGQDEDDDLSGDNSDGSSDTKRGIRGVTATLYFPDAGDRESRLQILHDRLEDEDSGQYAKEQVDEHEELPEPAQDPVTLKVVHKCEERGEVCCGGEKRQQPDDEEMIWHHVLHLRKADRLDANTGDDLLIGEGL